jgi:glycine cleavage system aminomethyltransferase T
MCDKVREFLTSGIWCSPSRPSQLSLSSRCTKVKTQRSSSFRGATATQFLEWLTPSSLSTLAPYTSTLSVFLNERGGIIDDTVITKHASDAFYVVTNAGRRAEDLAWFTTRLAEWNASERAKGGPVEHEVLDGWGLLALQGMSCHTRPFRKSALMTSKNK